MTKMIKVGEEIVEIEEKPITMIFTPAASALSPDIEYPGFIKLDYEVTTYHARKVNRLHAEFEQVWRLFMASTTPETPVEYDITADRIRQMGSGAWHLMGLIDMTLKYQDMKRAVVWKHPETSLHPGWAVALGDLAIYFSKRG